MLPRPSHPAAKTAFSLVELSIVLVILGLLVGGVITGQSLIRASQLNSLVKEYDQYRTAMQTFKGKYFGLPGDIRNATQFWGYQGTAGCNTWSGASASSNGACDGDGDGILWYSSPGSRPGEAFQAWRQLALAGLIPGNYSGMGGTGSDALYDLYSGRGIDHTVGVNCPASKVGSNIGWSASYFNNSTNWNGVYTFPNNFNNWFNVGTREDHRFTDDDFLTPAEAWSIDKKIDDGVANSGIVYGRPSPCASGAGAYLVTTSTATCALIMKP